MSTHFPALQPGTPLAEQLAGLLETEIRSGRLQVGQKLPTEAALVVAVAPQLPRAPN